jgi:hypothetical protein
MKLRLVVMSLLFLFTGLLILPVAQAQSNTCPALVNRALAEIGTNCAGLERNNVCYGYNRVEAAFNDPVSEDYFSKPSDRAGLTTLESLQTAPLNEAAGTWGIATMDVQANLPGALPGQSVVFILLGAVEIENAVPEEDALILPDEPLEVLTSHAAALRRSPAGQAQVVGQVEANTPLLADGISENGQWLRVFFMADHQATAWVRLGDLEAVDSLSTLPVITPKSRTPMQAFRFQTSIGGVDCEQAPSVLFIQGPENIEVDINANGADIRIGSSILLRTLPDGSMQIFVLSGGATLNPNGPNPLFLAPGFTSICPPLGAMNGNCEWSAPRQITQAESIELSFIKPLFTNASNLLHYTPSVPELVCASGVGQVACDLYFENAALALARASEECATGGLPASMCSALFPG